MVIGYMSRQLISVDGVNLHSILSLLLQIYWIDMHLDSIIKIIISILFFMFMPFYPLKCLDVRIDIWVQESEMYGLNIHYKLCYAL